MLAAGSKFGRYTVVRTLGTGGMGTVYLVRHDVLDAYFALKVLSADMAARNAQFIPRFLREAKLCCRIKHPNLVAVHDAGRDDATGLHYLVMDYAPGGNLREMLNAEAGPLDAARALKIARELASALVTAAEFGLVHRDIKPENIMFGQGGETKLADLGIAKSVDDTTLVTMEHAVFGTPAYMSPEQAYDAGKVDARADIYSLGIVLFEMLSGRRPYDGSSSMNIIAKVLSREPVTDVRTFAPGVSEEVAAVVRDMCEKDAAKRISSAKELLDRLDSIAGSKTNVVHSNARRGVNPMIVLSAAGGLVALTLACALAWGIWNGRAPRPDGQGRDAHRDEGPSIGLTPMKEELPAGEESAAAAHASPKQAYVPPKQATVIRPASAPAASRAPEPPSGDKVFAGRAVVIGGEEDDATAVKARLGAPSFLPVRNSARLVEQIDEICAQGPSRVYVKLGGVAASNGTSTDVFDNNIRSVADRLRDKGVDFQFVLEEDSDRMRPYNDVVREVCGMKSYEIFSDEKAGGR